MNNIVYVLPERSVLQGLYISQVARLQPLSGRPYTTPGVYLNLWQWRRPSYFRIPFIGRIVRIPSAHSLTSRVPNPLRLTRAQLVISSPVNAYNLTI